MSCPGTLLESFRLFRFCRRIPFEFKSVFGRLRLLDWYNSKSIPQRLQDFEKGINLRRGYLCNKLRDINTNINE